MAIEKRRNSMTDERKTDGKRKHFSRNARIGKRFDVCLAEYPGYMGIQDVMCIDSIEGIGTVYQQTFVDVYSKIAMARVHNEDTALAALSLLEDYVLPFFKDKQAPVYRVFTDHSVQYGVVYRTYLACKHIEHLQRRTRAPLVKGICEVFHKTMLKEFYGVVRKHRRYNSIEDLQKDVDRWIADYNEHRPYSGKYRLGQTPMQTFLGSRIPM
jgi:transposase InsO family protein